MKKITEQEENEMYKVISNALFTLCEEKPNDPVEFLSKQMLQQIGDNTENIVRAKKVPTIKGHRTNMLDEALMNVDKIAVKNLIKNFNENYKVIEKLGSGEYGEVFLVEDLKISDAKKVAKILKKSEDQQINLSESNLEMLLGLDHPNILKIYDIIEDEKHVYIIEEYCEGGDLFHFTINNKLLSEDLVKVITRQILEGLVYLHTNKIIHRNLKSENILIYRKDFSNINDIQIKIGDFNSVEYFGKRTKSGIIDSPFFIAPEVLEGGYNHKCDLWSVGAIVYTMLCGRPPFVGKHYQVMYKILHEHVNFHHHHPLLARNFMNRLLNKKFEERPEANVALSDPWFSHNLSEEGTYDEPQDSGGIEILSEMTKFVAKTNLKRSVLSYILTRKLYTETDQKLQKLFKSIDRNGDGHINAQELFETYGKHFPGTSEEAWEKAKKFVDQVDINRNGTLEYSEFLVVTSQLNKEMNKKVLKEVFNFYDEDGNGYITASNLREIFEDTDLTDEKLQEMVDEIDIDGDRKISFDEFYKMLTEKY